MYIDNIKVTDTVHLGDNNYKKIECSVRLSQGESANEAERMASMFNEEALRRKYPYLFKEQITGYPPYGQQNRDIPDFNTSKFIEGMQLYQNHEAIPEIGKLSTTEKTIMAINSFTQITGANGLESFKLLVKGKPELEEVYENKMKELLHHSSQSMQAHVTIQEKDR